MLSLCHERPYAPALSYCFCLGLVLMQNSPQFHEAAKTTLARLNSYFHKSKYGSVSDGAILDEILDGSGSRNGFPPGQKYQVCQNVVRMLKMYDSSWICQSFPQEPPEVTHPPTQYSVSLPRNSLLFMDK